MRRDRGAVLPLVALLVPMLLVMTAFAVDLGQQRSSRRTMQARADIVALDMVRLADGRTESQILADAGYNTYLAGSASRNSVEVSKLTVAYGTFTKAAGFIETLASGIPNAVKVTAKETTKYFFLPGSGDATRSAVASYGDPVAGFSIGSFGANLSTSNSGVLNQIVTPILGSPAGVSALSYQGLAGAHIKAGDLATELGLLNPDTALTTDVATSTFLTAAANVLQRNGDTANANILRGMITPQVQAFGPISIGDVVGAQTGSEQAALDSNVNVLDLLTASAFASKCTNPTDLSTCSGLGIPSFGLTGLPVATTTGSARIIQGVVSKYGPIGTTADTNQTEVHLNTALNTQQVGQCVPVGLGLNCIVGGLLVNFVDATVSVDATVKLADAHGTIAGIGCNSPKTLDISTRTGLYTASGTVTITFGRRGLLGGLLGSTLGTLTLGFNTSQSNVFDTSHFTVPPDVLGVTKDETGTGNIGLSNVALTTQGSTGILTTLGTLGITNTVTPLLTTLVNPLLSQLDSKVLGPLTDLLGVNVAGSDVVPLQIGCESQGLHLVG